MKQVYTYLAAAAMGLGAMLPAQAAELTPVGAKQLNLTEATAVKGTLSVAQKAEVKETPKQKVKKAGADARRAARKATAPRRESGQFADVNLDEWEYLGEGKYGDGIISAAYSRGVDYYAVSAYRSKANDKMYLFADIYPESYLETYNYPIEKIESGKPSTVILDASDPDDVNAVFSLNFTDGDIWSVDQYYGGTFDSGVFSFPSQAFDILWNGECYDYTTSAFEIRLPGVKDYSVNIKADTGMCADNDLVKFTFEAGEDAANLKYSIFSGKYPANANNLGVVAMYGSDIEPDAYELTFDEEDEPGWITIFLVSVDENNGLLKGDVIYFYKQPTHNADEWVSLGNADYVDDTVMPSLWAVQEYAFTPTKVEILESKANPGTFRVVNMIQNSYLYSWFDNIHPYHEHYIDFFTTENGIVFDDTALGAKGEGYEWSLAPLEFGKFENNTITFPTNGLAIFTEKGAGGYANTHGRFAITVPNHIVFTAKDAAGNPVEGVTVSCYMSQGVTDANGQVHLAAPVGQAASIFAYKDGYEAYETLLPADREGHLHEVEAEMEEATALLSFFVNDAEGEPIEGAYVSGAGKEGTTDANGRVTLKLGALSVLGKTTPVEVYKDGYNFYEGTADFTESLEANVVVTLEEATASVSFYVYDAEGEPVADAYVTIADKDATTDENGRAKIELGALGVILKEVPVTAYKDGYDFYEGTADFTETLDASVIVTLEEATASVSFYVYDAEGEPVEGAYVTIADKDATTDENGRAKIELGALGVIFKQVPVTAYKDGYDFYEGTADFTETLDASRSVPRTTASANATLFGNDNEGEPVEGAKIESLDLELNLTTDEFGRANADFGALDVLFKTFALTVTAEGHEAATATLDFTETLDASVVVTLTKISDGIKAVDAEAAGQAIYNLQGIRVSNPTPGLYIVDGKKTVIK